MSITALPLAAVERIASGLRWAEGPVWFGDARTLLCSDIPNNRILRWSEHTGLVDTFLKPSGNANGNTRDRQGRLITAEHAIAGAALDVFQAEPNVPPAFLTLDNVSVEPHIASATIETRRAIGELVIRNLAAHFDGLDVPSRVI